MSNIETIARRIHATSQAPDAHDIWRWITSWCPLGDWEDIGAGSRDAFIAMARASVEAMQAEDMIFSSSLEDDHCGLAGKP